MYKILGADHREYGPVSQEQLIAWIKEGRANGATPVQPDGATEWKPLSTFPEFQDALHISPPPPVTETVGFYPEQLLESDYKLDVGGVLGRAFDLVQRDFATLFAVTAIWLVIMLGIVLLSCIPIVGVVFSMVSVLIQGPLLAGLYTVFLRRIRGQAADAGGLFAGFSARSGQYILSLLIPSLLVFVICLPGIVLIVVGVVLTQKEMLGSGLLLICPGFLLSLLPGVYFGVGWKFTVALVADKNMDFWPAMHLSRGMVSKHFWPVLGLFILMGVINFLGLMLCIVGLLLTMPVTIAALMYAFETIFSHPQPVSTSSAASPA